MTNPRTGNEGRGDAGAVDPGAVDPGAVAPGAVAFPATEPSAIEPGAIETSGIETGAIEPVGIESGAIETGAIEPSPMQTGADIVTRLDDGAADPGAWFAGIDPGIVAGAISGGLTAVATVIAVIVAARYAYRHAREHSQRQHNAAIRVDRLRREIDALERIWGLLAYLTFAENDTAIVRYREDRDKHRTYYVNLNNLRRFVLTEMRAAFYTEHAGLHLPKDIRDELFEYQGSLIGLYLRYEHDDADATPLIELKSQRLIDKLRDHYQALNTALRAALEQRYQQLLDVG